MRGPVPSLLAALLVVAGGACRAGDPSEGAPGTVTTRAGDTVVVRTTAASDSATLRLVSELQIGDLDGSDEYGFGRVTALAPGPGSGVYVWDEALKSIRQYDAAGRFVRQVARRGRGPGEYENVAGMRTVGELLLFWDKSNQYVSAYDSAGALVHRWRPAYPGGPMGELYAGTNGRVYLRHHVTRPGDADSRSRIRTGFVGYDARGTPQGDTLPHVLFDDGDTPSVRAEGSRGIMVMEVPYAAGSLSVLSPLGYLVQGRSDRYAITLARTGAPPLRIERAVEPVAIGDDERADEEARITTQMRTLDPGWSWSGEPIPRRKPVFRRVLFDADGRPWVERAGPSVRLDDAEMAATPSRPGVFGAMPPRRWRETFRYDLFEPDGRFLGTVDRPARASVLYMRGDTVWGVVTDSLDVPYVTRWRLEPSIVRRAGGTP